MKRSDWGDYEFRLGIGEGTAGFVTGWVCGGEDGFGEEDGGCAELELGLC